MPSLNQRRLWQRERRLEEEALELNLMIASYYARDRRALLRRFAKYNTLTMLMHTRIKVPLQRAAARIRAAWTRLLRSRRVTRATTRLMRLALWWNRRRW